MNLLQTAATAALAAFRADPKVERAATAAGVTAADLERAVAAPDGIPERVATFIQPVVGTKAAEWVRDALSSGDREKAMDHAREIALAFYDADDSNDPSDVVASYGAEGLLFDAASLDNARTLSNSSEIHGDYYNNLEYLRVSMGIDSAAWILLVDLIRSVATSPAAYALAVQLPHERNSNANVKGKLTVQRRADILKKGL